MAVETSASDKDTQFGPQLGDGYGALVERLVLVEKNWNLLQRTRWDRTGLARLLDQARQLAAAAGGLPEVAELAKLLSEQLHDLLAESGQRPERRRLTKTTIVLTKLRLALIESERSFGTSPSLPASAAPDEAAGPVDGLAGGQLWLLGGEDLKPLAVSLRAAGWQPQLGVDPATLSGGSVPVAVCDLDVLDTTALKAVRTRLGGPAALLAVASDDGLEMRLAAVRAGCTGFYRKPVPAVVLLEQLDALTAPTGAAAPVLLISDNGAQGYDLIRLLTEKNISAEHRHPDQRLFEHLNRLRPQLLVLDLDQQRFDPIELVKAVRQHGDFADLHLITLAESGELNRRLTALGPDGIEVLRKPVARDKLLAFIVHRLRRVTALNARLERRRDRDQTSGLYQRGWFLAALERAVRAQNNRNVLVAVLLVRFDNLAAASKNLDPLCADRLLRQAADRLRAAGVSGAARFADNSFVFLCRNVDHDTLMETAHRLRRRLGTENYPVGVAEAVSLTVSVGAAVAADRDYLKLLRQAEFACDQATKSGAGGVQLFRPGNDANWVAAQKQRQQQPDNIREALQAQRFRLVFQPIVGLRDNSAERYEALLRIYDCNDVLLPTQAVFEFVKSQQHSLTLDRWVIGQALKKLSDSGSGVYLTATTLHVNLSPFTLGDETFTVWLRRRLEQAEIEPQRLVFEVAEQIAELEPDKAARFMVQLRSLGCGCSLERCGSGPDTLALVKRLPLNYVKLDPRLVKQMAGTSHRRRLLRGRFRELIGQLESLGVDIIVTGIEDAQSLALLWSFGVNYVQGYFLQRPHEEMLYDFSEGAGQA